MTRPASNESVESIADLEAARRQLAATVLAIRARYEDHTLSGDGQQLLSAAIGDLEALDSRLDEIRRTSSRDRRSAERRG